MPYIIICDKFEALLESELLINVTNIKKNSFCVWEQIDQDLISIT